MANYPIDAVGPFNTEGFASMEDRKPDRNFKTNRQYSTIVFESEAGYEKRRLRSRRAIRDYDLSYTNITGLHKEAIQNFFNARSGEFESFNLSLDHLNETGNVTVRFDGSISVNHIHSHGSNLLSNFYTVSFKLKEVFG